MTRLLKHRQKQRQLVESITEDCSPNRRLIAIRTASYRAKRHFRLYDTYGLPRDFIEDVTRDAGIASRLAEGFDRAMEEQRTRAKAPGKARTKKSANPVYAKLARNIQDRARLLLRHADARCRIEAIVTKQGAVNEIKAGEEAEIVLDRTSIYSESGGQVADTGALLRQRRIARSRRSSRRLLSRQRPDRAPHRREGRSARRRPRRHRRRSPLRRARNMRNHTATHLMNAALRNILGTHVKQAGSLVAPDHLRFDFSHFAAVDPSELAEIEQQVNEEILRESRNLAPTS